MTNRIYLSAGAPPRLPVSIWHALPWLEPASEPRDIGVVIPGAAASWPESEPLMTLDEFRAHFSATGAEDAAALDNAGSDGRPR